MSPKLRNISERNIIYFPKMHSPCKFKKNPNPQTSLSHSNCVFKICCLHRYFSWWAYTPHMKDVLWEGTAVPTNRMGVNRCWKEKQIFTFLMSLTHQTLLTSRNEWDLRFSHGINLLGVSQLKNREGNRSSAVLLALDPCRQPSK